MLWAVDWAGSITVNGFFLVGGSLVIILDMITGIARDIEISS
jgi:hypothetical protein